MHTKGLTCVEVSSATRTESSWSVGVHNWNCYSCNAEVEDYTREQEAESLLLAIGVVTM